MKKNTVPFFCLLLLAVICQKILGEKIAFAETLYIGSINQDSPANEIAKFQPIAKYLAEQLKEEGYEAGKIVVARDIPHMAKLIREGKVDIFIDSPFPVVAVGRLAEMEHLLRRWKKGTASYHSVVFTTRDSGIRSLAELKGKVIGFEDPYSSSGYLLPKFDLKNKGFKFSKLKHPKDDIPQDKIGYVFVSSDESIMVWVTRGKIDAGVLNAKDFKKFGRRYPDKLITLFETAPIPRQVVSARSSLSETLREKIKSILLAMEQTAEGRRVLKKFERTKRFDKIPTKDMEKILNATAFFEEEFPNKQ